jgi:plastocyanin domain-containing protein
VVHDQAPVRAVGVAARARGGGRAPANARRISIDVVDGGYTPARIEVKAGEPVVIVFTR